MITFNTYDLNNKQNVAFGTKMGVSAKRAIRKIYKGQKIPQSVKIKIQELKNDGIRARIIAREEAFVANKKVFSIKKNGKFKVKIFDFMVNIPKENKRIWLFSTNEPITFKTLFSRFKIITEKLPCVKEVVSIYREA